MYRNTHWYITGVSPLETTMFSKNDTITLRHHFEHKNKARGLDFALSMLGNYKSEQTAALFREYLISDSAQAVITRATRKASTVN